MTSAVAQAREDSFRKLDSELALIGRTLPSRQLSQVVRKLALEGLRRVVRRTPVLTGRARANWQVSIGYPAEGVLSGFDKSGASAISAGDSVIASIAGSGGYVPAVWISNNLPYALVLEEGGYPNPSRKERGESAAEYAGASPGLRRKNKKARARAESMRARTKGGYSTQAPRGMVAVTVQELLQVFAKEDSSQ